MFNTNEAENLILTLIMQIMKRFGGNNILMTMATMPLMRFDENYIKPMKEGKYEGSREEYFDAVDGLMRELQMSLNNLYDDQYLQLGELLDEKGLSHNIEGNNTLQEHTLILLSVWPSWGEEE